MTEVNLRGRTPRGSNPVSRFFSWISLFVSQVIDELRKVVRPTPRELGTYTAVVIIFVLAIMLFVAGLDFAIGKLVFWAFAG